LLLLILHSDSLCICSMKGLSVSDLKPVFIFRRKIIFFFSKLWEDCLNSDGQQIHQYQWNEQSITFQLSNIKTYMTLKIQVLAWARHKNGVMLNLLMGFQPQRFPALGLYSKLGLCNIWFYSGFGLDKFSCTYLLVRENRLLQNLNKTKIWIFFCQIFLNISDNFGKYEVFRFKRNQMHFFYFSFVLLRE
jgi:hypothetical protein